MEKQWKQTATLFFWVPKSLKMVTCCHETERRLLLGRKVMTNLDSVLKSRDIANKGSSSQAYGFPSSHVWMWELDSEEGWVSAEELMLLNCGVGEDSWEFLGLQGDPTSPSSRKSVLNIHWKDWCWGWNSNTLSTWCKELTHWKRVGSWERLKTGGEGVNRGWDHLMASPTLWTWVWASSRGWWWRGRPGMLQSMGSQRIRHKWATELNCTAKVRKNENNQQAWWDI